MPHRTEVTGSVWLLNDRKGLGREAAPCVRCSNTLQMGAGTQARKRPGKHYIDQHPHPELECIVGGCTHGSVTRSVHVERYAMFIQLSTQSAHRNGDIVIASSPTPTQTQPQLRHRFARTLRRSTRGPPRPPHR
jgi:hypothetical protein